MGPKPATRPCIGSSQKLSCLCLLGQTSALLPGFTIRFKIPKKHAENLDGMDGSTRTVKVELTAEEAYEILMRCLQSAEKDTPVFHSAIQRLARAIEADATVTPRAA